MRSVGGLSCVFVAIAIAAGCKTHPDADAAPDPAAVKQQEELLKRRDALITARQKLLQDRAAVQQQLHDAEGGSATAGSAIDTGALQKKLDELNAKLDGVGDDATKLLQDEQTVRPPPAAPNAPAPAGVEVSRELDKLRDMEAAVAKREAELAQTIDAYKRAADDWRGTCGAGTTIIQQAPTPAKGTFTKADVGAVLTRAHATMARKGLRGDDLGAGVGLEATANKAMNDGDWGLAMGAANQLNITVDSIKIDRNFIQTKFERLKSYVGAHKDAQQQAVSALQEITQKFGDQNYDGANKRMNELWAQLAR
jgi:hypothetical protein